jgi:hypothetical protein
VKRSAALLALMLFSACPPKVKSECDPAAGQGVCGDLTCVRGNVGAFTGQDGGTDGGVCANATFWCDKTCTTDDDCVGYVWAPTAPACKKGTCIESACTGGKTCSAIESGSNFKACGEP